MNNEIIFDTALNNWLQRAQAIVNEHHEKMGFNSTPETLSIDPKGKKYIRIVRSDNSVHCFIDKSNGNVLKAATWRAPAPHARGSIYTIGKEGVSAYGAHYLK